MIYLLSQSQIQGKQQVDKLQAERQATKWEKEEATYDEGKKKRDVSYKNKQLRKPYEMPIWLRVGNITMGILFVVLSIVAFQNRTAAVQTAIFVLAAIIFLSGFTRFINSFYDKEISGTKRLIRFSISIVLILIALFIYIFPTVGKTVLLAVLAIAIIVQGVGRIFMGTRHEALPRWLKISQITMGGISLILGTSAIIPIVFAITFPISIIVLLVIGFFVSGLSRISFGILGLITVLH